ncbi:ParA family partition ATPase [Mangrovicoccus algicola]|uniref:ParA family protein n=1 Tax=Mangrovicoccus algicola TaxID=2771008 RepID=A0A8J6YWA6_9RHOB|nr:ParA family partition ATPase [Mangrovicoccus algicola]MBE3636966.1 ParA family protein [Mangrovicoccus algicola]
MSGFTITVAQQKGGSGKTTLAVNLAVEFSRRGHSVAVLDTDPQGSLGRWFMTRRAAMNGEAGLDFATASAWGVSYELEKLLKHNEIVIVDTPPKVDSDLRPALRASDLVVVPVAVSQVDVWATESVLEMAQRERRKTLLVLNRAAPRARLTADIAGRIRELESPAAETVLNSRVIYAEVLGEGQGVVEKAARGPAAVEIRKLCNEIADILNS